MDKETALIFKNTAEEAIYKIGGINACINKRNDINIMDVKGSEQIIKKFIKNITENIDVQEDKEIKFQINKVLNGFKSKCKKETRNYLFKEEMVKLISERLGYGKNKSRKHVNLLENDGYIKSEKGNKNEIRYKLK